MKNLIDTILLILAYFILFPLLWWNKKIVRKCYGSTSGYDYSIAYKIDVFANHNLAPFWNHYLLTEESKHHFGHDNESLSSVLGKNQRDNTLTANGDRLRRLIDALDSSVENHCLHWINQEIEYQHKDFKLFK